MSDPRSTFPHTVQLRVLGALDLTGLEDADAAAILAQPKRLALLAYLAMAPAPHFRRRDTLLALFWPELDEQHARGSLRQALRFIRQSLGGDVLVTRGLDEIGVSRLRLECDALAFEDAIAADDPTAALDRYRGEFLDGVHVSGVAHELESWIAGERTRLRAMATDAARTLADDARRNGAIAAAATWSRRAYELSMHDERDLVRLLHALAATGDRSGALRLFDQFEGELLDSMNAVAATDTRALVERIRAGAYDAGPSSPSSAPVVPVSLATTPVDETKTAPTSHSRLGWWNEKARVTLVPLLVLLVLASVGAVMLRATSRKLSTAQAFDIGDRSRSTAARGATPRHSTSSTAAAEAYARGQHLLSKRDTASIRSARDQFLQAIDADPAYVDAWTGLSYAYGTFAHYWMLPSAEAFARADAAARKALTLDPTSGMARALLASSLAFQQHRWAEGERELREAIAMDSTQADAYNILGVVLRVEGRYDDALREAQNAARVDPLGRHYKFQEGHILICAGRFAEALATAHSALSLGMDYRRAHAVAATALEGLGRYREALGERGISLGDTSASRRARGMTEQEARHVLDSLARRDAADNLRELEQLPSGAFVPPSARANAYAAVGKWAQVFHWLDEALREKDMLLMQITCNRDYDPVRGDPRFIAMMREIGLPVTTATPPR